MFADRAVVALIAALSALCAFLWVATPDPAPEVPPLILSAVEAGYLPCEQEDSPGPCYWDATVRGNKQGQSFVITSDGTIFRDNN